MFREIKTNIALYSAHRLSDVKAEQRSIHPIRTKKILPKDRLKLKRGKRKFRFAIGASLAPDWLKKWRNPNLLWALNCKSVSA